MINFYNTLPGLEPVTTSRKCSNCKQPLGSANPDHHCATCKWLMSSQHKKKFF